MIVFNQKIIKEINDQVAAGQSVVVKLDDETEKEKIAAKKNINKTVDTVTSASFETKLHFAQSRMAAQNTANKKGNK